MQRRSLSGYDAFMDAVDPTPDPALERLLRRVVEIMDPLEVCGQARAELALRKPAP